MSRVARCFVSFPSSDPVALSTMHPLRVLGTADGNPAVFVIDLSSPHSSVSEAFLFRSGINPLLNTSGCHYQKLTLSVPSLGGYYTSPCFSLAGSVMSKSDIVLGNDWISQCRPGFSGNALGCPANETVKTLPGAHKWTANGTYP